MSREIQREFLEGIPLGEDLGEISEIIPGEIFVRILGGIPSETPEQKL